MYVHTEERKRRREREMWSGRRKGKKERFLQDGRITFSWWTFPRFSVGDSSRHWLAFLFPPTIFFVDFPSYRLNVSSKLNPHSFLSLSFSFSPFFICTFVGWNSVNNCIRLFLAKRSVGIAFFLFFFFFSRGEELFISKLHFCGAFVGARKRPGLFVPSREE